MKQLKYRGQTEVTQDEYLVADSSDLPDAAEIGSIAYTADLAHIWMMDLDGSWKEIGAAEAAETEEEGT